MIIFTNFDSIKYTILLIMFNVEVKNTEK